MDFEAFLFCFCDGRKVLNPCLWTLNLFMTTEGWELIVVATQISFAVWVLMGYMDHFWLRLVQYVHESSGVKTAQSA